MVSVVVQGQSVENRDIRSITLGKGPNGVLVTGSLHGSEWITTPALVETIAAYLKDYDQGVLVNGEPIDYILKNYSITFIPMVNPDGVTLAQEGADAFPDRKDELLALNPFGENFARWKANIRGVDLNRNYDIRWGEPITGTVASEPSYAFYGGPFPESEPETQVVANWIRKYNPVLLLDYHSYGEILYWYYLQTGDVLERDRTLVRAMRDYTGYRKEAVWPSVLPSSTLTYWGSAVAGIPSICVEVGNRPPRQLTMQDLPYIFSQVKYLPLVTIINLPDYVPYVPVESVTLPESMEAPLGTTELLSPVISPTNASNRMLFWSSSNPGVLSVDADGAITALEIGQAIITFTSDDGGHQGTSEVTVYRSLPRLSDTNRYTTAVDISLAGWDSAEVVVLARGDDFADGLAGVPLAHHLNAPLLLTPTSSLNLQTKGEIVRLGAKTVYILGETGAVAKSVEEELADMGLEVVRIGGSNRYETAAEIARQLEPDDTAVIAYGNNFPDALSVASYAAANGFPILLTNQKDLHPITGSVLAELGIKNTIVVGGTAVVSDAVLQKLPNPLRIQGPNRYATAVEIAKYFHQDNSKLYAASGLDFADALTGAALAAKEGTGVLLIGNTVSKPVQDFLSAKVPEELVLLGGPAAVPIQAEIILSNLLEQLKVSK
jgi:putative cell wall-binding protein